MPVFVIERVVIFDQGLYHGNGDVIRWCRKITDRFGLEARHYAPRRSGELQDGITTDTHAVGIRQVQGTISSNAPHTMFVLRGTDGPIRTTLGWNNPSGAVRGGKRQPGYYLRVRAGNGFPQHFAFQVRGQRANNFLLKAWRATARDHTAIRGHIPGFILDP